MAFEHQVRIAGGPNQLPSLVFIPYLINSTVGSLRAAISPAFHPASRAPAHSSATMGLGTENFVKGTGNIFGVIRMGRAEGIRLGRQSESNWWKARAIDCQSAGAPPH